MNIVSLGIGVVGFKFYDRFMTNKERNEETEASRERVLFDMMQKDGQDIRAILERVNNERISEARENVQYHRENDKANMELLLELKAFMEAVMESNSTQTVHITTEMKNEAGYLKSHINDKIEYLYERIQEKAE